MKFSTISQMTTQRSSLQSSCGVIGVVASKLLIFANNIDSLSGMIYELETFFVAQPSALLVLSG